MTILHVYDESNAMAARYADMLMKASQCTMRCATNLAECLQVCEELHPDILHLHGATTPFTLPVGLRLVVTPHGMQLGPVRAFAVVARSPLEEQALKQQFPRVETVLNPLITRTTTPEACARQMEAIYQRVMDSNVLQLMDATTRQWLYAALAADTYGDTRWLSDTPQQELQPPALRQISLYAYHEGVLPQVQRGLQMLGVNAPEPETFSCYLPDGFRMPQPMPVATIRELLADISANGPTLLRLCELARSLHSDNLNEEALAEQLDEDGQLALLSALLPLLADYLLLTEGFMPCQPANNPTTQQLRNLLARRQEI